MSNKAKPVISLILAAVMLAPVASVRPVVAGDGSVRTKQHIRETVTWSLTHAVCPDVASTTNGIGKRNKEIKTTTYASGVVYRVTDDTVKGVATDSAGKHEFAYKNHLEETILVGGLIKVHMIDTFKVERHGTPDLKFDFEGTWSYLPPDPILTFGPDAVFTKFVGNDKCDPI